MTSVLAKLSGDGPVTMTALGTIDGGQLVAYAAGGVNVSGAASELVAGVALAPAKLNGGSPASTTGGVLDATILPGEVAVVPLNSGATVTGVTYAAAATHGQRLKSAANGQVTPWVTGTDAVSLIVGRCAEPAGVGAAGTGSIRLGIA